MLGSVHVAEALDEFVAEGGSLHQHAVARWTLDLEAVSN
jgi:hypothetical protein